MDLIRPILRLALSRDRVLRFELPRTATADLQRTYVACATALAALQLRCPSPPLPNSNGLTLHMQLLSVQRPPTDFRCMPNCLDSIAAAVPLTATAKLQRTYAAFAAAVCPATSN